MCVSVCVDERTGKRVDCGVSLGYREKQKVQRE